MRLQNHIWSVLMTQDHLVLHLFMHRVVGVLKSPFHAPVSAPTRYLLSVIFCQHQSAADKERLSVLLPT
jgi:hypothetical protein